jgi:6-phosphofructokinase 1
VGADTALNHVVEPVDRIRHTSVAARRCFVVETMGGYCGYLALMSGISAGAVRVYLHEEGVTLGRWPRASSGWRAASRPGNGCS